MKRLLVSSSAATVVVFGLFVLMVGMIHQDAPASDGTTYVFPGRIIFLEETTIKPRPPKEKPKLKKDEILESIQKETNTKATKIFMDNPTALNQTKLVDGELANSIDIGFKEPTDGNARSIVAVQPIYPPEALSKNLQGWVKLGYDITPVGTVENVTVIAANPRGVFEKSARKALYRWRYKPSREDGKAVASNGHVVVLEFNIEDD